VDVFCGVVIKGLSSVLGSVASRLALLGSRLMIMNMISLRWKHLKYCAFHLLSFGCGVCLTSWVSCVL
jgi:hypothetical protein